MLSDHRHIPLSVRILYREVRNMNKTKRRIISGAIVFGCVMTAIGAGAKLSKHEESGAVPASLTGEMSETPVIILDAGHGGST